MPSTTTTTQPNISVEGRVKLELVRPKRGATVRGNAVAIEVRSEGVTVGPADHNPANKNVHYHVFVDREPVAPNQAIPTGDPAVLHFSKTPPTLYGLPVGEHRLAIVLGSAQDTRFGRTQVEARVNVVGPAVTVTAPKTVPKDAAVPLDLRYGGATFAMGSKAPPGSLHVAVLIDKPRPRPGAQLAKGDVSTRTTAPRVELSGLPSGRHTIWVIVVDSNEVVSKPLGAAMVTVTVQK